MTTPPRQCMAFSTSGDRLCGRDTYDVIEMGLVSETHPGTNSESWEILVEVPVCDLHEDLKEAVSEEVNPTAGARVSDLDGDSRVLPTFRMSVIGLGT